MKFIKSLSLTEIQNQTNKKMVSKRADWKVSCSTYPMLNNNNLAAIYKGFCGSFGIQVGDCEIPVESRPKRAVLMRQAHAQVFDSL